MKAAKYDFEIDGDSNFDDEFTYTSEGVPVDLTGCQLIHEFIPKDSNTAAFSWSTVNGKIILSDATNGKFKYNLQQSEIASLQCKKAVHQFSIIYPSGNKKRYFKGFVTFTKDLFNV